MYYLETSLGQFSSSNCVKIWALSPAMKGTLPLLYIKRTLPIHRSHVGHVQAIPAQARVEMGF